MHPTGDVIEDTAMAIHELTKRLFFAGPIMAERLHIVDVQEVFDTEEV